MSQQDHLKTETTDRGFEHYPPMPLWAGYFLTDKWEIERPREIGTIRVYESSEALTPSIWVRMQVHVDNDGRTRETRELTEMMTIENARKLGEQLIALANNHYSISYDSGDDDVVQGEGGVDDPSADRA